MCCRTQKLAYPDKGDSRHIRYAGDCATTRRKAPEIWSLSTVSYSPKSSEHSLFNSKRNAAKLSL